MLVLHITLVLQNLGSGSQNEGGGGEQCKKSNQSRPGAWGFVGMGCDLEQPEVKETSLTT